MFDAAHILQIRYELKALICPVGSPLFPSGALTLVKAAKGDWWRFSPSVGTASGGSKATGSGGAGLEPGHIQRLTREEVDTFDQLHAVTAIYARQETEQEAEMSLTPIWVSEYLKVRHRKADTSKEQLADTINDSSFVCRTPSRRTMPRPRRPKADGHWSKPTLSKWNRGFALY